MKTLQSTVIAAGLALLLVFLPSGPVLAGQTTSSSLPKLRGTIKDPSGAAMSAVDVVMIRGSEVVKATKSDPLGVFSFDLPAGQYQLAVTAPDFRVHKQDIRLVPNMPSVTVTMSLEGITTAVDVVSNSDRVVVDAGLSLDARVITAEQLEQLPEDQESLLAFLQALAGGEGNAQLLIDGFEGGRMPTRDQIAQIVIEPNSFNANGTGPRITVVSRQPGGTRWTGNARFQYRDSALNARTPHAISKPPSHTSVITTSYTGPVIKGKLAMTFNLSKQQSESGNNSIRAITPSGPVNTGVFSPSTYDSIGFSQNWYLSTNHTIYNSFDYNRSKNLNQGIGGFSLEERASDSHDNGWNLQISDNKTFSPKMTNTFNFRMSRGNARTAPRTVALGINVVDAFYGGGAQNRSESSNASYNLNDTLRWTPTPKWNLQFNLNMNRQSNYSLSENNYLGTFTFSSLEDYLAGRALTFTQTSGNPIAQTSHMDANVSVNATYRISQTMSYSAGAQYAIQTHLKDYNNVSPTTQFQIQLKKRHTISVGARMTYSNFPQYYYEQLIRGDGTTRQFNTVISNPSYPDPFAGGASITTTGVGSSRQLRDPHLQAPYTFNTQVSLTESLPKNWRLTGSFSVSRSVHQIRNRNINAPFPGTPLSLTLTQDEINQLRPFYPNIGRITRFESVGNSFSRNLTLLVQVPSTTNKFLKTQISGTFQYNVTWSEDDNSAQNPYNVRADWARNDQRHRVNTSFSIRPPKAGSFSFTLTATSGRAYSITTGKDENFDQAINDRPEGVKRNSLRGPGSYVVNLNWSSPAINVRKKKAPVGETAKGGAAVPAASNQDALIQSALSAGLPPAMIQQLLSSMASQPGAIAGGPASAASQPTLTRPQLTFTVSASNLLNNTRVNGYSGVITSPLFGRPTSYGAGRSITLSLSSRF